MTTRPAAATRTVLRHETPLGTFVLVAEGDALVGLWPSDQKRPPIDLDRWPAEPVQSGDDPVLDGAARQLDEFLTGARTAFDLPLAPHGTAFQREVWEALRAIPYGTTATYAQLAVAVGRPAAVRAVGQANGRNPIAVVVPCHRVVGADGSLTGYAGGTARKAALLRLEQSVLAGHPEPAALAGGPSRLLDP
jgi:methylated-DNA-[protein]-cysteine S-methyltransferase